MWRGCGSDQLAQLVTGTVSLCSGFNTVLPPSPLATTTPKSAKAQYYDPPILTPPRPQSPTFAGTFPLPRPLPIALG